MVSTNSQPLLVPLSLVENFRGLMNTISLNSTSSQITTYFLSSSHFVDQRKVECTKTKLDPAFHSTSDTYLFQLTQGRPEDMGTGASNVGLSSPPSGSVFLTVKRTKHLSLVVFLFHKVDVQAK